MRSAKPRKYSDEDSLHDCAVKALGRRMRTVAELKRLLRQKVDAPDPERLIEAVIERLKAYKYLNDTQYATTFTSLRKENQLFGKRRVIADLAAKGVHKDVIQATVHSAYADTDEEQQARAFLDRKRVSKPQDQKGVARIARMLMRAGFSSRAITRALNHLSIGQDEAALESIAGEELGSAE